MVKDHHSSFVTLPASGNRLLDQARMFEIRSTLSVVAHCLPFIDLVVVMT